MQVHMSETLHAMSPQSWSLTWLQSLADNVEYHKISGYNQSLADNVEYHKILYPGNKWFHSWRWDPLTHVSLTKHRRWIRWFRDCLAGAASKMRNWTIPSGLTGTILENLRHLMICGTSVCLDEDLQLYLP
jgi:hypothetical protein